MRCECGNCGQCRTSVLQTIDVPNALIKARRDEQWDGWTIVLLSWREHIWTAWEDEDSELLIMQTVVDGEVYQSEIEDVPVGEFPMAVLAWTDRTREVATAMRVHLRDDFTEDQKRIRAHHIAVES